MLKVETVDVTVDRTNFVQSFVIYTIMARIAYLSRRSPYGRPGPSPTNTGADGPYETLLAGLAAKRDRYELLLDINNAIVTKLSGLYR